MKLKRILKQNTVLFMVTAMLIQSIDKLTNKTLPKALSTGKVLTLPIISGTDSYTLILSDPETKTTVSLKVVNPGFDKNELKGINFTPDKDNTGKGSVKITYTMNRIKYKAVIKVTD